MKKAVFYTMPFLLRFLLLTVIIMPWQVAISQNPAQGKGGLKLEIYYFHPSERCPIDESIEDATRQMMRTDFAREIKEGIIKFRVLNTDDKANAKTVEKFEMNAQALYLVYFDNGKEVKKDLTEFAFSTCQSNPGKFKAGLKQDILTILK